MLHLQEPLKQYILKLKHYESKRFYNEILIKSRNKV